MTDDWCPENDGAYRAELVERHQQALATARAEGCAAGIEAAVEKVKAFAEAIQLDAEAAMERHPQVGEDRAGYAEDAREVVEAIRALISSTPAPVMPKVKPLVWRLDLNRTAYAQATYSSGRYCIEHRLDADDQFDLWIGPDAVKATRYFSLEVAKAAAQADHEARIRAQIEMAPVTVQQAAGVLEDAYNLPMGDALGERVRDAVYEAEKYSPSVEAFLLEVRALAEQEKDHD